MLTRYFSIILCSLRMCGNPALGGDFMRHRRRSVREKNDCQDEYECKEISEMPVGLMRFGDGVQLQILKSFKRRAN